MATPDDPDRPTLSGEDLDRIRARLAARVNLGLDPASPAWLDAIAGSIFGDLEGPAALEVDQLYDFADVIARAVIPSTAFGVYLDEWAESLGLERKDEAYAGGAVTFTGAPGAIIAPGQQVTTTAIGPDGDPIAFQVVEGGTIGGGGALDLVVLAVAAGAAGNVSAATVTIPSPAVEDVTAVSNPAAMTGGADVEDDEQLHRRVDGALSGSVGAGNISDYERWGLAYPGVGFVTVRPVARGPGTVDVYVTDIDNAPMPSPAVDGLQAQLDPVAGQGLGLAPIGHDVLVLTPDSFIAAIVAEIQHDTGYTLDGAGGTRATQAAIEAAIRLYIDGLAVGADIVRNKVVGVIVGVRGVANVTTSGGTSLTINASTADTIVVPADEVAVSGAITLT